MARSLVVVSIANLFVLMVPSALPAQSADQQAFMAQHYPPTALKNGEEGKVGFAVDIGRLGIEQCRVTVSSGFATLDRETCDFIVRYMDVKPVGNYAETARTQTGIIDWKLPAGFHGAAAPRRDTSTLPPPLICKRNVNGSVPIRSTVCMTKAEWNERENSLREQLEDRIGSKPCSAEGC